VQLVQLEGKTISQWSKVVLKAQKTSKAFEKPTKESTNNLKYALKFLNKIKSIKEGKYVKGFYKEFIHGLIFIMFCKSYIKKLLVNSLNINFGKKYYTFILDFSKYKRIIYKITLLM